MSDAIFEEVAGIMRECFGCDKLIALAIVDGNTPCVRAVKLIMRMVLSVSSLHTRSAKMR